MLEFILGKTGTGKTSRCLSDITKRLEQSAEGTPLLLILPEHMTFKIERRLAILMNKRGGFSRAYVFGFRRLCRYILNRNGGAVNTHITEIGKKLLLSRVILENKKELTSFAKAANQRNFTSSLCQIIEELKTYGITVNDLEKAGKATSDETLSQKLNDIALLYNEFNKTTQDRYNDNEDLLSITAIKIQSASWLEKCEIWVDGFIFFNPQELTILKALFHKASHIHLSLCIDDVKNHFNNNETALFHRQYHTFKEITELCKQLNIGIKYTYLTTPYRFLSPAQKAIENNMFIFPLQKAKKADGIIIAEAANHRLEVEAAAIDIIRLCREEAYSYNDIGIIIRDNSYANILQAVLHDYQIPFFSDNKRLFIHHPLAELLRSCMEAINTWQYEPLMRCFKTDFFPVTRDEIDLLENYVLEFGIKGKKHWLDKKPWQYFHQSFSQDLSIDDTAYLDKINDIRYRLIKPLAKLAEEIKNAADVRETTTALYNFLITLAIPKKLSLWQDTAEKAGNLALAKEQQQIWHDTIDLFDQIVETCGIDKLSLKEYAKILNDGLESLQIALIPPGLDYVTIASFDQNSLENKDAIYILGANEGIMPRRIKSEGLLTDSDRFYLQESGIKLSGGSSDDNFFENFLLYKAFTLSRKYTWVSYSLSDSEGGALNRSSLIDRLHYILPLKQEQTISILLENYTSENEKRRVVTPRRCISYLTTALRQYREKNTIAPFWFDVYNWLLAHDNFQTSLHTALTGLFAKAPDTTLSPALAACLYTKDHCLNGSVTRFEQFHNCPFKHFSHYALNLSERIEFSFSAPDRGILLHETMHCFGEILLKQNRHWNEISPAECHDLCRQIIDELAPKLQNQILLSNKQYEHLTTRIRKTAEQALERLCSFACHSEFFPIAMEKPFGSNNGGLPPLIYNLNNGYKINITGQIDRIDSDKSGKYFLIIDYKSGNAYINLTEVYYGLKLQLLTYLLAVQNSATALELNTDPIPAGILYCFLKTSLLTFNKEMSDDQIKTELIKQMRMPGWLLLDPSVIKKIDDSASFIKVRFNKNGSINKLSRTYVKSEAEFNALLQYMDELITDTGKRILQGEASITPYKLKQKTACMFCPYIAFCRFDLSIPGYEYNKLIEKEDDVFMQQLIDKIQPDKM
ncbi:helicase-exonuclease AddAB subunit AddB [Pectinatus sottacetonis]|uniref:helicase-exonuclease AddAB subunit AddB n=1 Tax=Pectinatus sottacetonis TaxID=1002795 RepID=UPI0018C53A52|nr:helicase-exonuclease AddAB subunit AddB [Pectinatus sottacetonis]